MQHFTYGEPPYGPDSRPKADPASFRHRKDAVAAVTVWAESVRTRLTTPYSVTLQIRQYGPRRQWYVFGMVHDARSIAAAYGVGRQHLWAGVSIPVTMPQYVQQGDIDRYYIYSLVDPRDSLPHYVGQTIKLDKRYGGHLSWARSREHSLIEPPGPRDLWLLDLAARGLEPRMGMLELVTLPEEDRSIPEHERARRLYLLALEREMRWYWHGRQQNWPLTNVLPTGPMWLPHDATSEIWPTFPFLTESVDSLRWHRLLAEASNYSIVLITQLVR